ncbi:MAG: arginine--tRNA ligase [Magnetococcales bacterium]|nr:arginine--tRNA ligase [Magnetococcales bacterium]
MRHIIFDLITTALQHLQAQGVLPPDSSSGLSSGWRIERPRDKTHGDFATNAAMVWAKTARLSPRDLAQRLIEALPSQQQIERCEVAGPGFINFHLSHQALQSLIGTIQQQGDRYGCSTIGQGERVQVEFVSANPTGPMHVGHGRGAVVGDVLCRLLTAVGYQVEREYYINDAGGQMLVLGRSLLLRYFELSGREVVWPEACYPGDYVRDMAEALHQRDGDRWLTASIDHPPQEIIDLAIDWVMVLIRADLEQIGIHFDHWFSERQLHQSGAIDHALAILQQKGLIYTGLLEAPKGREMTDDWEPQPQMLFRAQQFGDVVDRPLKKSDGSYTYFAADMAYHLHKAERGFDQLINIWGADHGGYVKRIQSALEALTGRREQPQVLLVQMVNLTRAGQPVRMSKRAGTFVTLREVMDETGVDAVRFWFLTRSIGAQLDFDLQLAVSNSNDNPVFYVQYAHARICSILRQAVEQGIGAAEAPVALLTSPAELDLLRLLGSYPELVEGAALARETHRLSFYLLELAAAFHTYYNEHRVLDAAQPDLSRARLALVTAVRQVLCHALQLMGVSAPERM